MSRLVAGKRAFAGSLPKKWGGGFIQIQRLNGVGKTLAHVFLQDPAHYLGGRLAVGQSANSVQSPSVFIKAYGFEGRHFVLTLDVSAWMAWVEKTQGAAARRFASRSR